MVRPAIPAGAGGAGLETYFLMTTCLLTHEQPWTRSSPAHLVGGFDVDQPSGARGEIVALGGSASRNI